MELIYKVFSNSNEAAKLYSSKKPEQKRKTVEDLLWNLSLKNKTVASCLLKTPYQEMSKMAKPTTFEGMLPDLDSNQDERIQSPLSYH